MFLSLAHKCFDVFNNCFEFFLSASPTHPLSDVYLYNIIIIYEFPQLHGVQKLGKYSPNATQSVQQCANIQKRPKKFFDRGRFVKPLEKYLSAIFP